MSLLLLCVCMFCRRVWIRSSSFCFLSWMKTRAGIWRKISRCLAATRQIQKTRTLRRAIWCMVINVFGKECVVWPHSMYLILIVLIDTVAHISLVPYFSAIFEYFLTSAFFFLNLPFPFSCKRTHVWEPSRIGDVCRGQRKVVHLWARHRGGHPWCLFRGEHLQEAEHKTWHSQPVPSHHCYCRHAAEHSWLVVLHTYTHTLCCHAKTTSLSCHTLSEFIRTSAFVWQADLFFTIMLR